VKGKVQAGKQWVKDKAQSIKDRVTGKPKDDKKADQDGDDPRSTAEKTAAVNDAVKEVEDARKNAKDQDPVTVAKAKMPEVKAKYGLKAIELVEDGPGKHHVEAEINPRARGSQFGFGAPKETAWGPLRNECGTWMLTFISPDTDKLKGSAPQTGSWPSWW